MRVLALDTTTRTGSVALIDDDRVLFAERGDPLRSQAERLPGELTGALASAGLAWSDIDLFAVAAGPGSFTGLRIGIATIQGLALACGKRVVPVSALLAASHAAAADARSGDIIAAWLDAQRRQVFSALYRVRPGAPFESGRLEAVEGPAVGDPGATWQRWAALGLPAAVIGEGAVLYAGSFPPDVRVIEPPLLAPIVGRIAIEQARLGNSVDPAALQPLYIRRPDVEIARDAVAGGPRD